MLPMASGAEKVFRIERKANVARVQMVVPVGGQIVPFIVLIDKAPDTARNGTRRAEIGAVEFAGAAAVEVTDHQLSLSQFFNSVIDRGHGGAINCAAAGVPEGAGGETALVLCSLRRTRKAAGARLARLVIGCARSGHTVPVVVQGVLPVKDARVGPQLIVRHWGVRRIEVRIACKNKIFNIPISLW